MSYLNQIYKDSLFLLTDLYQITMAYSYWKSGMSQSEGAYHLFFRKNPFEGGYTIAAGLGLAVEYLQNYRLSDSDAEYLSSLRGADGSPLLESSFIDYLREMRFGCDIDAVPEGSVMFPFEPILRVKGPLIQCQLLETPLLNMLNFSTLVATKAARICDAAEGEPILEFGLRRAQGIDGGIMASRAAYIGGCSATSNVYAGKVLGIPVRGTHAHSWVMCFDDEQTAFDTWAEAMPNNCIFLVDTYDTLEGVRRAARTGEKLRENGCSLAGVRLDSGDLAWLSRQARKILDEAGFPEAKIVASNDLEEHLIASLKRQQSMIDVWGVGTKLVTAYEQPALGGVYKLSAIRKPGEDWKYRVKLSEQLIKVSNPGIHQVRRFYENGEAVGDAIFDTMISPKEPFTIIDQLDMTRRKKFSSKMEYKDLLEPVFQKGELIADQPDLQSIRKRTRDQLKEFYEGIRRFENPHQYPAGLERNLFDLKVRLVLEARGMKGE